MGEKGEEKDWGKQSTKTPANPSLLWGVETSARSQQFERKQKIAKWYKIWRKITQRRNGR